MKKSVISVIALLFCILCLLGMTSCNGPENTPDNDVNTPGDEDDGEILVDDIFAVSGNTIVGTTKKAEKYLNSHNGELEIPQKIAGKDILAIGDGAFDGCVELKKLVIPSSVESIGFGAFRNCKSLQEITVPFVGAGKPQAALQSHRPAVVLLNARSANSPAKKALTSLSSDRIVLIDSKKDKDVFEGNNGNHFGYIFGAENHKKNKDYVPETLTDVTITGTSDIEENAFYHCESIETVDLDYSTRVADNAFEGCTCVFAMKIPGISGTVELNALENVPRLLMILANNLDLMGTEDFITYRFENGCLIDDNYQYAAYKGAEYTTKKRLVWANSKSVISGDCVELIGSFAFEGSSFTEVVIPAGIAIEGHAFAGCPHLGSVVLSGNYTVLPDEIFAGCEGLRTFTIPDGVTSIGNYAFSGCLNLTSVTIPDSVTSIGDYAFADCSSLTSVTIPDSVTSIGKGAFTCSGLESITIPDSVTSIGGYVFEKCFGLTSFTYPSGMTEIAEGAFSGCMSLTGITIPNGVTVIGESAFQSCTGLTEITIPDSVTEIGEYAFAYCGNLTSVTIPDGVTSIGDYAFYGCNNLMRVTVSAGVTSIGYDAFCGCNKLLEVYNLSSLPITAGSEEHGYLGYYALCIYTDVLAPSKLSLDENGYLIYTDGERKILVSYTGLAPEAILPDGITEIRAFAFYCLDYVTSVTIPEGVTSIGESAFAYCENLTSVTIPGSVTDVGYWVFSGCTSLTNVTMPGGFLSGTDVWMRSLMFDGCPCLQEVDGVTYVGNSAFYCDPTLNSVVLREGTTAIWAEAFRSCELTSITIPSSVTSIGENAFAYSENLAEVRIEDLGKWCGISFGNFLANPLYYAHNLYLNGVLLTEFELPSDLTRIAPFAFYGSNMTSVTIPASVTFIGKNAFSRCSMLTSVAIPDGVTSIEEGTFMYCDNLTSVTIPNSVTSIGLNAFSGCRKLTGVTIPDGVTSFGNGAFASCVGLKSVSIPNDDQVFALLPFDSWSKLESIVFRGEKSEWKDEWNRAIPKSVKLICCSDGDISLE